MGKNQTYNEKDFKLDFIGIGAAKSGTTWLSDNLRKHPDIFIPEQKELVYFNAFLSRMPGTENPVHTKPLSWYHDFFKDAKKEQIKGEISVEYLINENTAQSIYDYNPHIKILVVLRYPPKQLFSLYLYLVQRGVIAYPTFEKAIEKRPDLFLEYHYYKHLKVFYDVFPKEQIKVLLFDEMKQDNKTFFKEFLDFIGAKEFYPDTLQEKSNATQKPRVKWLNHIIQSTRQAITQNKMEWVIPVLRYTGILPLGMFIRDKLNVTKMNEKDKPTLSTETEQMLKRHYQEDTQKLATLINKDLTNWL